MRSLALRMAISLMALADAVLGQQSISLPSGCYLTTAVVIDGTTFSSMTRPSFSVSSVANTIGSEPTLESSSASTVFGSMSAPGVGSSNSGSVSPAGPSTFTIPGISSNTSPAPTINPPQSVSTTASSTSTPSLEAGDPFYITVNTPDKVKRALLYVGFDGDGISVLVMDKAFAAVFVIDLSGKLRTGNFFIATSSNPDGFAALQLTLTPPDEPFVWDVEGGSLSFGNATFCSLSNGDFFVVFDSAPSGCGDLSVAPEPGPPEFSSTSSIEESTTASSSKTIPPSPSTSSPTNAPPPSSSRASSSGPLSSTSPAQSSPATSPSVRPSSASPIVSSSSAPVSSSSSRPGPSPSSSLATSSSTTRPTSLLPPSSIVLVSPAISSSSVNPPPISPSSSATTTPSTTVIPSNSQASSTSVSCSPSSSSTTTSSTTTTTTTTTITSTTTATSSTTTTTTASTTPTITTSVSSSSSTSRPYCVVGTRTIFKPLSTPYPLKGKRGLPYDNVTSLQYYRTPTEVSWAYDYFRYPNSSGTNAGPFPQKADTPLRFYPLVFNDKINVTAWIDGVADSVNLYNTDAIFSFNEPDLCYDSKSACMDVNRTIVAWARYIEPFRECGIKLIAPSIGNAEFSIPWLRQFMGNATQLGYKVDALNMHHYGYPYVPSGKEFFANYTRDVHAVEPNIPVWVTEYGLDSGNLNAPEKNILEYLNQTLAYADGTDWISKIAWFGNYKNNLLNADGSGLSARGTLYSTFVSGRRPAD